MTEPVKILFVCLENSNRSQMAEAFARKHGDSRVEAWSAGSRPSGKINPKAVAAMAEKGINLTTHTSKGMTDLPDWKWDWVITMGCGDACPHIPAENRDDWALPDPKNMEPDEFNRVRDEIEQKILKLLGSFSERTV